MKSKTTRHIVFALGGGIAASVAATAAFADTTDDLLSKLLAKGILTQQEYNDLKQRKEAEPAAAPVAPTSAMNATEASSFVRMMDKGIGLHVGSVDIAFSGEINGFYTYDSPQKTGTTTAVAGGLAAVGSSSNSSVRNGLLPNNFNVDFSTHEAGLEVHAHFGMYPGLNSSKNGVLNANSGGSPVALGTSGIDFRQQYLTVGNDHIGTFKVGRDIGLYGQEAILNDFTLFGVGSTGGNIAPGNTSLGRIGIGYIYADFMPQITYTTPTFGGFSGAIGIFQPLDAFNASGLSGSLSRHDAPMFQGKIAWASSGDGPLKIKAWANLVTQSLNSNGAAGGDTPGNEQGTAGDFGAKVDFGPAEITGTGYVGSGVGTTGLYFDAVSATGAKRDSDGYYIQASYTFFDALTFSGSYGDSHLDLASGEINPLLVKDNESYAFGGKYKLTSWVNLIAEYTHTTATAHGGNKAEEDTIAAGAIGFF